jgi:TetR/AcrR family transcriptional regulator
MSSLRARRVPVKRKRNAEVTKTVILDAALREFAEQGFAGARMDEIAKVAAVNKALLYYYFESKDQLFIGVIHRAFLTVTDALHAALSRPASPGQRLLAFLDANFEVLAAQPLLARLLGQEVDMLKSISSETISGLFQQGFLDRIVPLLAEFRTVLAEGVKTGEFRTVDIDAVVPLLIMLVRTAARGMPMVGKFLPGSKNMSAARRRAAAIDLIKASIFTAPLKRAAKTKSESKK